MTRQHEHHKPSRYRDRREQGGRTVTVRLTARDVAMLDRIKATQGVSAEAAMRNGMWFWAREGLQANLAGVE